MVEFKEENIDKPINQQTKYFTQKYIDDLKKFENGTITSVVYANRTAEYLKNQIPKLQERGMWGGWLEAEITKALETHEKMTSNKLFSVKNIGIGVGALLLIGLSVYMIRKKKK
jgi:hypothetical protein